MCDTSSIITAISAGLSAASSVYSYNGMQKAQKSQDDAAYNETQRQKRIQRIQGGLIEKQETEKEKGRQAFQALQPQFGQEETSAIQTQAADTRNNAYQQSIQPQQGADPTAGAAADTAVVDSVAETPIAVRAAYDDQAAKGAAFSGQQASARAFLDALNDAQQKAGINLSRGAEKIGMEGDFVSGLNRPINAYEGLKGDQTYFQTASANAAQQGADAIALGDTINSVSQLGYAYGTRRKPAGYTPSGPLVSSRVLSQRPIT